MEPHDYRIYYVNIDLRHQYGISVAESQTFDSSSRNVPFREERGETAVSQPTSAKEFYHLQRAKFTRGIFLLRVLSNHERFYWCAVDQTRSRHRKCSLPRRPLGELGNETRAPLKTPAWEATGNVTRTVLIQIELCARRHTRQGGKWFAPKWRQLMRFFAGETNRVPALSLAFTEENTKNLPLLLRARGKI